MKAISEIGWRRTGRFGFYALAALPLRAALFPPLRAFWLRILGAHVGPRVVLHDVRFFNLYRTGFKGLHIGRECFLGDECLLDLAECIHLEDQVTLAERVVILTHLNVGYRDHPLQRYFPAQASPVYIDTGSFIGANATILPGCRIGARSFVAAGSVVTGDIPAGVLAAGVPARVVRPLS